MKIRIGLKTASILQSVIKPSAVSSAETYNQFGNLEEKL